MALDRIATSGAQAHLRAAENAAHNISQLNVEQPVLLRTRFRSEAPAPAGPGGVRAETEIAAPPRRPAGGPVLSPEIRESFVRDDVDLVQELTDALIARRGFQANLAAQRASRSFLEATLNLAA
ncbi:MAG TPA: hypothetical protein VFX49_07555 [Chloroflexota bacterium]|nr:hypothetical protein [Chloroflexota bacterium]